MIYNNIIQAFLWSIKWNFNTDPPGAFVKSYWEYSKDCLSEDCVNGYYVFGCLLASDIQWVVSEIKKDMSHIDEKY